MPEAMVLVAMAPSPGPGPWEGFFWLLHGCVVLGLVCWDELIAECNR